MPQLIYLNDDTFKHNIVFGRHVDEIDEKKLLQAVSLAGLDELVNSLPKGLDTLVGDRGIRISVGQRQRLGIARALYHEPELLVLDEATSSLDGESEHAINVAIESLKGKKTIIIIAHRLSTVRNCDKLIFLEKGCITSSGTFNHLLKTNKSFKNLVALSKL